MGSQAPHFYGAGTVRPSGDAAGALEARGAAGRLWAPSESLHRGEPGLPCSAQSPPAKPMSSHSPAVSVVPGDAS